MADQKPIVLRERLMGLSDEELWDKLGTNEVAWFNGADELHRRLVKLRRDYDAIGHAAVALRGEQARLRAEIVTLRGILSEARKALHTLHQIMFPREGQSVDLT